MGGQNKLALFVIILLVVSAGFFALNDVYQFTNGGLARFFSPTQNAVLEFYEPAVNARYGFYQDPFPEPSTSVRLATNLERNDISNVSLTINGVAVPLPRLAFFPEALADGFTLIETGVTFLNDRFADGTNVLTASVMRTNGTILSSTVSIIYDTTLPTLSDLRETPEGQEFRVADLDSGVAAVSLLYGTDDRSERLTAIDARSYRADLRELSRERVSYRVTDGAGNVEYFTPDGKAGWEYVELFKLFNGVNLTDADIAAQRAIIDSAILPSGGSGDQDLGLTAECAFPRHVVGFGVYTNTALLESFGSKGSAEKSAELLAKTVNSRLITGMQFLNTKLSIAQYPPIAYPPVGDGGGTGWVTQTLSREEAAAFGITPITKPDGHMGTSFDISKIDALYNSGKIHLNTGAMEILVFDHVSKGGKGIFGRTFADKGIIVISGNLGFLTNPDPYSSLLLAINHEIGHGLGLGHTKDPDNIMCTNLNTSCNFPFQMRYEANQLTALLAHVCGESQGEPITFQGQSGGWFGVNIYAKQISPSILTVGSIHDNEICGNGLIGKNELCEESLLHEGEACVAPNLDDGILNVPSWPGQGTCNSCSCGQIISPPQGGGGLPPPITPPPPPPPPNGGETGPGTTKNPGAITPGVTVPPMPPPNECPGGSGDCSEGEKCTSPPSAQGGTICHGCSVPPDQCAFSGPITYQKHCPETGETLTWTHTCEHCQLSQEAEPDCPAPKESPPGPDGGFGTPPGTPPPPPPPAEPLQFGDFFREFFRKLTDIFR